MDGRTEKQIYIYVDILIKLKCQSVGISMKKFQASKVFSLVQSYCCVVPMWFKSLNPLI